MILLPKIRVAQAVQIRFFLGHFGRREVEKSFYRHERVADVMAQAGGEQAEADDPVGDHHVAQHGHFFTEQLVAFGLHHEKFQALPERERELRRIPRFGDVFVNRAAVDGGDGGVHVRVSGDQDAENARPELPGAFQEPDAFFAGHPLVGHQQADFVGVLFEQLEAVLGVDGGEDAEFIAEGAGEILSTIFPRHPRRGWRIFYSRRDFPCPVFSLAAWFARREPPA